MTTRALVVGLLLSISGLLGLADLRMDPRYDSHVHCMQHQRALIDLLGQQFSTRTRQECA